MREREKKNQSFLHFEKSQQEKSLRTSHYLSCTIKAPVLTWVTAQVLAIGGLHCQVSSVFTGYIKSTLLQSAISNYNWMILISVQASKNFKCKKKGRLQERLAGIARKGLRNHLTGEAWWILQQASVSSWFGCVIRKDKERGLTAFEKINMTFSSHFTIQRT